MNPFRMAPSLLAARAKAKEKAEKRTNRLATATTGALGELIVSVDLLTKGYEVFRSLSPACSCDLLVLKDRKAIRVEVTTATLSPKGKPMYATHDPEKSDVIALVFPDRSIRYIPQVL